MLNDGQANSFIVKLNHAIDSLNSKPDQPTACNQLQAFVNEVNAYVSVGQADPGTGRHLARRAARHPRDHGGDTV